MKESEGVKEGGGGSEADVQGQNYHVVGTVQKSRGRREGGEAREGGGARREGAGGKEE